MSLAERVGERIYSRLNEMCDFVRLDPGIDMRKDGRAGAGGFWGRERSRLARHRQHGEDERQRCVGRASGRVDCRASRCTPSDAGSPASPAPPPFRCAVRSSRRHGRRQ